MKKSLFKLSALKYNTKVNLAPKVIVNAQDEKAKKLLKIANENDIPVIEDGNLVDILSCLKENSEIPKEIYDIVAEIYSFLIFIENKKHE